MVKKGVSAIIATILLLMITIALAGTAYVYMSGMVSGRTSKTISILDASCSSNQITLVISNDGTLDVAKADIKIFVKDIENTTFILSTLAPHTTGVTGVTGTPGANTVLVVSPSNAIRQVVYC